MGMCVCVYIYMCALVCRCVCMCIGGSVFIDVHVCLYVYSWAPTILSTFSGF